MPYLIAIDTGGTFTDGFIYGDGRAAGVKVELGEEPGDLSRLKAEIDRTLREKLVFRADVELVSELPRYAYKGKLVRKLYE